MKNRLWEMETMNRDRLQPLDGSMAKSPEGCGGVVMVQERSMMKKSMNSVLSVAMVAVMAMVFVFGMQTVSEAAYEYGWKATPSDATGTSSNTTTLDDYMVLQAPNTPNMRIVGVGHKVGGSAGDVRFGVYFDTNATPDGATLRWDSGVVTAATTGAWHWFPVSPKIDLPPNQWFGVTYTANNGGASYFYDNSSTGCAVTNGGCLGDSYAYYQPGRSAGATFNDALPASYPTGGTSYGYTYSHHAVYVLYPTVSGNPASVEDGTAGYTVTGNGFEALDEFTGQAHAAVPGQTTSEVWLTQNNNWGSPGTKVAQTITAWNNTSITFTSNFGALSPGTAYLWVENSDGEYTSTGIAVTLTSPDATPPSAGIVTITNPASGTGTYVPSSLTFETVFTDSESAVTCEYTTNGSTWIAGTISGGGPYTCSDSPTGLTGAVTLNMRGTSGGGGPTPGTALNRTVDDAPPVTTAFPAGGTYGSDQSVTLIPTDAGIGVASTAWCFDAAGTCTPGVNGISSGSGTSVTVTGVGGTDVVRYLRFTSTDTYSNAETVKSETYNINQSNATPTLTITDPDGTNDTVSVGDTYNVAYSLADSDNTVTVDFYYDTNADMAGGTAISGACTGAAEGAGVTCAWDTTAMPIGSYYVYGVTDDGVNPAVSAVSPGMITINPIINSTAAGTASVSPGNGTISVNAPYTNDSNGNNDLLIEWGLNGVNFSLGSSLRPHAASPYVFNIPSLTNGTAYQVQVTYQDNATGDGVTGSAVQTFTNIEPSAWVDNDLLHNSLRFACDKIGYSDQTACEAAGGVWDETKKWATGWGTDTGEYGPIMCSTCHTKGATNIKRIRSAIPGSFPGSGVVANNASTDYGADNTTHGTSDRVCEVCHSQTIVHKYNMPAAVGHNGDNCIGCHEHNKGFRASCSACHGNPPVDAATLVFRAGAETGSSNSDGWGAHATHVTTEAFTCDTCHGTSFGTGASHSSDGTGSITIEFNAYGSTAGDYDGQVAVTNGYDGVSGLLGTVDNSRTCDAVYCHGGTINGTSPAWNGAAACGSCHAAVAGTVSALPSGTSHNTHANTLGLSCSACHGTNGAGPSGHLDGDVSWDVTALPNTGATVTYNGSTTGTSGSLAPSTGSYGTCSNVSCHFGNVTPAWDNGPLQCNDCHNNGSPDDTNVTTQLLTAAPPSGQHDLHVNASDTYIKSYCVSCHGAGSDTASHTGHADGSPTFPATGTASDPMQESDYSDAGTPGNAVANDDTCATACHLAANWGTGGSLGTGSGISWTVETSNCDGVAAGAPVVNYCLDCHDGAYGDLAGPAVAFGNHTNAKTADETMSCRTEEKNQCLECHVLHDDPDTPDPLAVWIPNPPTQALRTALGLDYKGANHHGSVNLKRAAGGKPSRDTEAEICWECHDSTTNGVRQSEWEDNSNTGSTYNYGTLDTSNWTTATWTSAVGIFSYKTGPISSTHSVNWGATRPGVDAVGDIRCSYCHDVHNTHSDSVTAAPYLRGTWKGNPYREDGAPETNVTYTDGERYGPIPRGGTQYTEMGGYQIDQNNGNPTSTWTLADSAGLCTLCHSSNVDSMNEFDVDEAGATETPDQSWVGTNGHSAAVIGGTNSVAANIFTNSDRGSANPGTGDPDVTNGPMAYQKSNGATGSGDGPGDTDGGSTTRGTRMGSSGGDVGSPGLTPYAKYTDNNEVEHRGFFNWGVTVDNATIDPNYHNFSCSKCHNPHASRLPRLMISNCLDTSHNTWDDDNGNPSNVSGNNAGTQLSDATTAQNCHRKATVGGMGSGWNNVTPW
jgi:predicted CxxxxCH...CXXCH cytochrome family protein